MPAQEVKPSFPANSWAPLVFLEAILAWWVPEWTIRQDDIARYFKRGLFMPRGYPPVMDRGAILSVTFIRYYLVRAAFLEVIAVEGFFSAMLWSGALKAQPIYWLFLAPLRADRPLVAADAAHGGQPDAACSRPNC